jgi:hypothetical protein
MAVTKADLDRVHELEGSVPDDASLACLATVAEVVAFLVAQARAEPESGDEADLVELTVRSVGFTPDEVRALERELRPLGYGAVSDRLAQIAGRRHRTLRPLP